MQVGIKKLQQASKQAGGLLKRRTCNKKAAEKQKCMSKASMHLPMQKATVWPMVVPNQAKAVPGPTPKIAPAAKLKTAPACVQL